MARIGALALATRIAQAGIEVHADSRYWDTGHGSGSIFESHEARGCTSLNF